MMWAVDLKMKAYFSRITDALSIGSKAVDVVVKAWSQATPSRGNRSEELTLR